MPEMPTLGAPPKQSPILPIALTAVVVGCLTGGIFWLKSSPAPAPAAPAAQPADPTAAATTPAEGAATPPAPVDPGATLAVAPAPGVAPAPTTVPVATAATTPGLKTFSVTIRGPLESAIVESEGKSVGTALTQVVNRSLVWWMRVPQDLTRGDRLSVVYETREGQEPLVHAVRFSSGKFGKTFEAYRYKGAGEFARYYQADGSELEERLVHGPLDSWEQVTSLLRDGRRHKGVDYKTPVGTPVKAVFDGVVKRKNWNFRGNGNSIELEELGGQGRTAMYLHLAELPKGLAVGQKFKRGEVMARSGNTGHSFAPHLHYQLMKGDKVVDPFESHQTTRASLAPSEKAGFDRRKNELGALFPAEVAAN